MTGSTSQQTDRRGVYEGQTGGSIGIMPQSNGGQGDMRMSDDYRDIALRTDGLTVGYGGHAVLRDVTLQIRPGEVLALIGPNGAGKSTLLRTVARQLAPLAGTVWLGEKPLPALEEREMSRMMSILMTDRARPELMTCAEVVALGRYPYTGRFGILSDADRRQIAEAMALVGVSELAERDFSTLSDGQQQRVMLARAICQQPQVMILDEPASYLDIRHKLELLRILRSLARERNMAVLVSLHELELAQKAADTLACVKDGRIDLVGTPAEIFAGDYIRRLYEADEGDFREVYGFLDGMPERSGSAALRDASGGGTDTEPYDHACSGTPADGTDDPTRHYIRCGQKRLRCGYTTGTCAALAAEGAVRLLLDGSVPEQVSLMTPKGWSVTLKPVFCRMLPDGAAECGIRKDAGDDPDITDGITVIATVRKKDSGIDVDGGEGVGRVTKPGLDQPVGAAAINRMPRRMIAEQAEQVCAETGYEGGLRIEISIPGGAALAARTFNPQLGVEGGLSILGTSGIVEPMSEQALVDTIAVSLRQAAIEGGGRVILSPGNYSGIFLREQGYETLGIPVVKYSNYLGEALDLAAGQPFREILLVGHIGKLVKVAGGIMNTHSRIADCRTELFCAHAAVRGGGSELCRRLMSCATADACLALLREAGLAAAVMEDLLNEMQRHLEHRACGAFRIGAVTFSNTYGLLGMTETAAEILNAWKQAK